MAKITQEELNDSEKTIPYDVLLLLVRTRTYIRLRYINKATLKLKARYKAKKIIKTCTSKKFFCREILNNIVISFFFF